MVTARRENTTCDIRSNGAYGIIVGQERNQVMDSGGMPGASPKKERNRVRRFRDIGRALCRCSIIANRERCVNPPGSSGYTELRRLPVTIPRRTKQKAQWITTAASLPSTIQQAAVAGAEPRGGCLLPFSACGGHGRIVLSAQSRIAWPTRLRVDRRARPTDRTGQSGGIAAQGS